MTIVFRLPPSAAERAAFSYSPVMDAVLSLHVLVEPKHHPVQQAFAREWERIESDLAASVSEAGRVIARHGLYALLGGLWPEVRSDPGAGIRRLIFCLLTEAWLTGEVRAHPRSLHDGRHRWRGLLGC